MTLVELMIGMTVGLFVVLVAVAIFVSTRTLHTVGSASTRMSENARLAMDLLQQDIRNAGFAGCRPLLNDAPVIVLLAGDGGFLTTGAGIAGYREPVAASRRRSPARSRRSRRLRLRSARAM